MTAKEIYRVQYTKRFTNRRHETIGFAQILEGKCEMKINEKHQ
jgi:hypothetical protein